jgi:hypothetical protein
LRRAVAAKVAPARKGEDMRVLLRSFIGRSRSVVLLAMAAAWFLAGASALRAENPHVFRVVDRRGRLVGYPLTENLVAREINGVWVTFYLQPGTGIFDSRGIYVAYLTNDCTGTPYIAHYSTFSEGTRVGPTLYYPVGTQELTPRSVRVASAGEPGVCTAAPYVPGVYGVATTVEIDTFGLEAPFKAVQ